MTKTGAAYLAASFLTSRRVAEVATDYIAWIDSKTTAAAAIDALLAASRVSKNPDKVLAQAAVYYPTFGGL